MSSHILAFECTDEAERSIRIVMAKYNCDRDTALRFAMNTGLQILDKVDEVIGVAFVSKLSGDVWGHINLSKVAA